KAAKVSGKKVILRADLDLPLRQASSGQVVVSDDTRLRALLPTLKFLLENKAQVLIIGHLGRPKGKKDPKLSLEPVAEKLSELSNSEIKLIGSLEEAESFKKVVMLENLRFWPEEEKDDSVFAKKLASFGDLYVNDAFAASHREHASIVEIPKHLPAYAGLRLEEEVKELGSVLVKPERPLIFIIGGAKTETKKPLVPAFAKIADKVLLGGLLMFSRELERIPNVVFPIDAKDAYDIGPKSVKFFTGIIKEAKTVVWNGPLGVWEKPRYARGTRMIAEELALLPGKTIAGGGDTIAALNASGLASKISYVSLGGGAMLEFLAGKKLPGLVALGHYD
ncbi:phosphoglycerate kinase, partial [candidate division WWE3 bacterium CG09_land_8_20_14_0_10_47_33]